MEATAEEILERVRSKMQEYVDIAQLSGESPVMVNAKQVLNLLSPTWPDGNYHG